MSRVLVQKTGVVTDFEYNAEPTVADLQKKSYKTMFVVIGSDGEGARRVRDHDRPGDRRG